MKKTNRCFYALGLVVLTVMVVWAGSPGGDLVMAQVDTPRPTPTNVGGTPPTATPVPPTPVPAQPAPGGDVPPQQGGGSAPASAPVSSGQATVPHTGLLSPGAWSAALAALALLGVIFGARYLRGHGKDNA